MPELIPTVKAPVAAVKRLSKIKGYLVIDLAYAKAI